jgi:O-antigen/teichoic acid export membrane protein
VRKAFSDMNPTVRGFLLIALVALVIVALSLQSSLLAISMLLRVAFFLAMAFFVYLMWRERRSDIATWSDRSRYVFYGAALTIVADLAVYFAVGASGLGALAFILVLPLCGYAMFRTWRSEHTYS